MKKVIKIITIMFVVLIAGLIPASIQAKDADGDYVVIVDAGHGGRDGGAFQNNLTESELNWNIAVSLKAELETYAGVKVYFTRGYGEWNTNAGRGRFGNLLSADLFISCHNNSGGEHTEVKGSMIYGTVNSTLGPEMKKLGELVLTKLSGLGFVNSGYQQRTSSNDPSRDYYTALDEATKLGIPSMIIEHCYLTNSEDAAFIGILENQYKAGAADATAIAEYLGLKKRTVSAGSNLKLIRTYSAEFTGVTGTFSSSDDKVAYVSDKGVITAVSEGSATITCKGSDGTESIVYITVPAVVQVGVAAGINPTFYNGVAEVNAFNKAAVMVKAVYNDGSVFQVNGTVGDAKPAADGTVDAYDIPVSYGGYENYLRIYSSGSTGTYDTESYIPASDNKDILLIPTQFTSPIVGPVKEPETTESKPAETEGNTETESVTGENTSKSEIVTTVGDNTSDKKDFQTIKIIIVILIAVCLIGVVFCSVILMKNKRKRYKRRR